MFIVNEFRWITTDDNAMREFSNWSRPYEYAFVLDKIKSLSLLNPSIHNTSCGYADPHLRFAKRLSELSSNVTNSDILVREPFSKDLDIIIYNIEQPNDKSFDIVLCISTLEDIYSISSPAGLKLAFDNLINQVSTGGRLLITCDYPSVPLECCEELIGQKISNQGVRMSSENSIFPDFNFKTDSGYYSIIAMDLTKI